MNIWTNIKRMGLSNQLDLIKFWFLIQLMKMVVPFALSCVLWKIEPSFHMQKYTAAFRRFLQNITYHTSLTVLCLMEKPTWSNLVIYGTHDCHFAVPSTWARFDSNLIHAKCIPISILMYIHPCSINLKWTTLFRTCVRIWLLCYRDVLVRRDMEKMQLMFRGNV